MRRILPALIVIAAAAIVAATVVLTRPGEADDVYCVPHCGCCPECHCQRNAP